MRILASGDIHGDINLVNDLARKAEAENVDLVILCGDLTHFDQSSENLIGPFLEKNKKVVFVPGNHETLATADFLAELYGATNLHGYAMQVGDVGIFGAGGATQVGPFLTVSEDDMLNLLKRGFETIKDSKIKVMVTHEHPSDSLIEKFTEFFQGSKSIRKAITLFKPDLLLCSHVHEAAGLEEKINGTKVINVGRSGKIIDL